MLMPEMRAQNRRFALSVVTEVITSRVWQRYYDFNVLSARKRTEKLGKRWA
jgi:hypothetical protein